MKVIRNLLISIAEPIDTDVGRLKPLSNGTFMLFFFGDKGWSPVSIDSSGDIKFQYMQEIPDIII